MPDNSPLKCGNFWGKLLAGMLQMAFSTPCFISAPFRLVVSLFMRQPVSWAYPSFAERAGAWLEACDRATRLMKRLISI